MQCLKVTAPSKWISSTTATSIGRIRSAISTVQATCLASGTSDRSWPAESGATKGSENKSGSVEAAAPRVFNAAVWTLAAGRDDEGGVAPVRRSQGTPFPLTRSATSQASSRRGLQ